MKELTIKLIEKAVDIWCKKLDHPTFDNGDNSLQGAIGKALAQSNIDDAIIRENELYLKIEKFREHLTSAIEKKLKDDEHAWISLSVDYGPCQELAESALFADIPDTLFSIKSRVELYDNSVSASFGYGAKSYFYYYMDDGEWLVTTLRGEMEEIQQIINHIKHDKLLDFKVEIDEAPNNDASN